MSNSGCASETRTSLAGRTSLAENGDLSSGMRSLQIQLGEMREFLECQLSIHRDLLDRLTQGAEHSSAVSPAFLGIKAGTGRTSLGTLDTIEEDSSDPGMQPEPADEALVLSMVDKFQTTHLRTTRQAAHEEYQKGNWRLCIKEIVFSPLFSLAITLLILLNVILLGVEVDVSASMDLDEMPSWFATVNAIIVAIFVLEMLMKHIVAGCRGFWCGPESGWNIFDFCIVLASVLDLVVDIMASLMSSSLDTGHLRLMRSIRVVRALRGIRVVRIFRYVTALRTLALSIISTMSSLFWTLALLILVFYLFAIVITQLVLEHCRHSICSDLLHKFWGSVPESMLTLFMAITNGLSWDDAIRPLREASYVAVALVIFYVTISVFAILNVVTGVFCNTAIESAHADKEVATIKQVRSKDQQVEALKQVFLEINNSRRQSVTFEEMADAISNGELASFMEAMGISTDDIRTLYTLLDADKDGRIDLDEFVSGCMQLHGPAKSLQLAKMSFENKFARDEIQKMSKDFADLRNSLKFTQKVQPHLQESF